MTRNRLLTLLFSVLALQFTYAQVTYTDDFDAYTAGTTVVTNNPTYWRTWGSTTGGAADDAFITDAKAASGANSFIIEAKVAAGGPMDLILKLGNNVNKGKIHAEWNMYVEPGYSGYFNFQSTTTAGTGWAMDFNFSPEGDLQVVAGAVTYSNKLKFPVGEWFNFAADIDISNNMWAISIDGECGATFRSALSSVASVDFFANSGNKYYIDDVSFTTDAADIKVYNGSEAGLLNLVVTEGLQIAGTNIKTAATLYNVGKDTITSIEYTISGGSGSETKTLEGLKLAPKKNLSIAIPVEVKLVDGANDIVLELTKVNGALDSMLCNNKIVGSAYAVLPATHRKVVLEEGTGTWCGWCPRGAVFLDAISPSYDDYFVPIAVHNGDVMTVAPYDNVVTSFDGFTGFPGMIVDRREVVDPSAALPPGLNYLREEPAAVLTIGAREGAVAGTMDVSVTADFLQDIPSGYSMYITVIESEVRGTTSEYNQSNYYAGGASGPMGGYESLPGTVPAAQMVYKHVARTFDNSLKNMPSASIDDKNVYNYNIALNGDWNIENLKIAAVLLNEDGQVSNANDATIADATTEGFVISATEKILLNTDLNVYPNPAKDLTTVELTINRSSNVEISLVDVQGRTVLVKDFGQQQGKINLPISIKGMTSGVYTAIVRTNEGMATKRLVIQ